MIKPPDPRTLVVDLIPRSICAVQVAAVIADSWGIVSWGWNHVGSGFGLHAECHAIQRANKSRLKRGATLYVASVRRKHGRPIMSKPCQDCQTMIDAYNLYVTYRDAHNIWIG
jgi:pyrimidine deaminase RibD-like protein